MGLKEILVCVEPRTSSLLHVRTAAALAARNGAQLSVLYVQPSPEIPVAARLQMPDLESVLAREDRERADKDQARCVELAAGEGQGVHWEWEKGNAVELFVRRALSTDLVVVAQAAGEAQPDPLIGPLVLHSGRPVLVVPETWEGRSIGQRVALAWNGGGQASRVVHDAMPILRAAEAVSLVMVVGADTDPQSARFGVRIADHLSLHGVSAERKTVRMAAAGNVGEALLAEAVAGQADLLAMGAFGRPNLQQVILGSVTNTVLSRSTLPVLLAH